ncbi:MAG: transposase [Elusimicrobia bacterium]|nr:transposase [Elusimicrobiota bacterium]
MARPLRVEFDGAFYHVLDRGISKQEIFADEADYLFFLQLMGQAHQRSGFTFHAYCLMPNHYHLLIETPISGLSEGMRRINGLYAQRFNYRHDRVGHLFQDRFKSYVVDTNAYWLSLSRYIHQNPVRAGMVPHPWEYRWSSCQDLLSLRPAPNWLRTEPTLRSFADDLGEARVGFAEMVDNRCEDDPLGEEFDHILWGGDEYVTGLKKALEPPPCIPEILVHPPAIERPSALKVEEAVKSVFAGGSMELAWRKGMVATRVAALLLHEKTGLQHTQIARRYGISEFSVTKALARLRQRLSREEFLRGKVDDALRMLESTQCQVEANVRV